MRTKSELKRYTKEAEYSYTWGLYPTIELLTRRPDLAQVVYYHTKAADHAGWEKVLEFCNQNQIQFEHNDRMVSRLQGTASELVIGVFKKQLPPCAETADHIVLVNVDDMGNLGTIMRTMRAFDFSDLVLIEPAADVFHPKVVRASMGALFQMHVSHFASLGEYCRAFPQHQRYLFAGVGENLISEVRFISPFALVFGNEGSGLASSDLGLGKVVQIPQSEAVDSLNLAVAAGIALYAASAKH